MIRSAPDRAAHLQRFYVLLSLAAFCFSLSFAGSTIAASLAHGVLAVVQFAVLAFFVRWFVATRILVAVHASTTWLSKTAIVLNYLTVIVAFNAVMASVWAKSAVTIALVIVTRFAASGYLAIQFPPPGRFETTSDPTVATHPPDLSGDNGGIHWN